MLLLLLLLLLLLFLLLLSLNSNLCTVNTKVTGTIESDEEVRDGHGDIHLVPPELLLIPTRHHLPQLQDADEGLAAVTDSKHEHNCHQDGRYGDVSLSPLR